MRKTNDDLINKYERFDDIFFYEAEDVPKTARRCQKPPKFMK